MVKLKNKSFAPNTRNKTKIIILFSLFFKMINFRLHLLFYILTLCKGSINIIKVADD